MASMSSKCVSPANIYVIGTQYTGKSTLVSHLERHLKSNPVYQEHNFHEPQILQEGARNILREYNFTAADIRNSKPRALELQRLIVIAYCQVEMKYNTWYISDRSILDALVYAQQYGGSDSTLRLIEGFSGKQLTRVSLIVYYAL